MKKQIIESKDEISTSTKPNKSETLKEHKCIEKINPADLCFFKYPHTSHLDKDLWVIQSNSNKKLALFCLPDKRITEYKYDLLDKGFRLPANCYVIGVNIKQNNTYFGVINRNGDEVIPPIYDDIICFQEDLAVASINNKFGYINMKNDIIIPFIYDKADDFSNGLAKVILNNKKLIIDKNGNIISQ